MSQRLEPLHRVVALTSPPQSTFELACAAEVFGIARDGLPTRYDFSVCAVAPGPVATRAGYDITVNNGLSKLRQANTIVIPGWPSRAQAPPVELINALNRAHARGARIVGLCSGTFLLAAAGLLDGRWATTHWRMADELKRRYPLVNVQSDDIFIDLGDVSTSAGTGAAIDLCLHLVRTDQGAAYAHHVSRHMVMPSHREGDQRQYAATPSTVQPSTLAPLLEWASQRIQQSLSIEDLAREANTSTRTIARRFQDQVGMSPGQWILNQRVLASRVLLEETDMTVDRIAQGVGLSSATNFRRRFLASQRTTPAAYRRAFRHERDHSASTPNTNAGKRLTG